MNVDLIIKSKWIAPVDSKETLIKDHAIVINDKKIVALCPHQAADKFITTNTIELDNHILIPEIDQCSLSCADDIAARVSLMIYL